MPEERISISEEQLSELMKSQRLKGAERSFKYVFASAIVAALITAIASNFIDEYQTLILAITILVSAAAYAMITSD